jgi:hypothetical protein
MRDWWTKWYWGSFPPSTSVSYANSHTTNYSTVTIIYYLGLKQYPSSGRSIKWTQSQFTPRNPKKFSTELSPSCEIDSRSATQEFPIILRHLKVHCFTNKSLSLCQTISSYSKILLHERGTRKLRTNKTWDFPKPTILSMGDALYEMLF